MRFRLFFGTALVALMAVGCSQKPAPAAREAHPLAPGEKRYALTGEVVKADPDHGVLQVKHENVVGEKGDVFMHAMTMEFHASRGDISIYTPSRRIKADLIVNPQSGFRLENIWPDDRTEADIVAAGTKLLREDTLIKGKNAYRDVGDAIPDFSLYDQTGKVVEASRFKGKQLMINFIYTQCPDPNMCPLATTHMLETQALAKEAGVPDIEFISITLDPEFDTPGILNGYAVARHIDTGNFTLLTGPEQAIKDLFVQFGIDAEFKGSLLVHTLSTVLVGRDGKVHFRTDGSQWDPADFVARMQK